MAGQAVYDMFLNNMPGMKPVDFGTEQSQEGESVAVKLKWLPTADELLHAETQASSDQVKVNGPDAWASLLTSAARPLKRQLSQLALENDTGRKQGKNSSPAIADAVSHGAGLMLAVEDEKIEPVEVKEKEIPKKEDEKMEIKETEIPEKEDEKIDTMIQEEEIVPVEVKDKEIPKKEDEKMETKETEIPEKENEKMEIKENEIPEKNDQVKKRKVKKTFAGRYQPHSDEAGLRWQVIRDVFQKEIEPVIKTPATFEDSFYKQCQTAFKANRGQDVLTLVSVATEQSALWLESNSLMKK